MIENTIKNLHRLQKLLRSCKGCAFNECILDGEIHYHLEYLNVHASYLIDLMERLDCENCRKPMSLDDLLHVYSQSHNSISEGDYGYSFPLPGKRNADVFIVYPRTKYERTNDGRIIINSDPQTLEGLCSRSEKYALRRRIYLPNADGTYSNCGEYVFDVQRSKDANSENWISIIIMQADGWQRYDKMYIIDSLLDGDNTAFNLEQQVNKYFHLGRNFCSRIKVATMEQWKAAMEMIIENSNHTNVPIIHLEIHGDQDGNLVIGDNVVKIEEFLLCVDAISKKCNAKVLLTLAVCRGLTFFTKMQKKFATIPCSYVIGSSQPLWSGNIEERFGAFYKELLQDSTVKVDIRRAFNKMQNVFKDQPQKLEDYKDQHFVMMTEGKVYC